jgi:hypothetical protein
VYLLYFIHRNTLEIEMTTARHPYLLEVNTIHGGVRGYRAATLADAIAKAKTVTAPFPIILKTIRESGKIVWTSA